MILLKNERVLHYFEEISKIPRCSGQEREIFNYLIEKGKEFGAEVITDDNLNILLRKEASPGKEEEEPVALQGHMDMVCIKEEDSDHDFSKDPIPLLRKGEYITADGTTLGADNGVALAMMLAILEDKSLVHPPLELIMTSGEEIGLLGAKAFPENLLKSKKFINLDTDYEGILTIGCAGSVTLKSKLTFPLENLKGHVYELELSGYPGGHSGTDIHKNIPNPLSAMVEILKTARNEQKIFFISSLEGGNAGNSIPTWAKAVIVSEKEMSLKREDFQIFQTYDLMGISVDFSFKELDEKVKSTGFFSTFDILDIIDLIPNGVLFYRDEEEKEVLTSANTGIVRMKDLGEETEMEITTVLRSSLKEHLSELPQVIENLILNKKGKMEKSSFYHPWEPVEDSPLQKICLETFKELEKEEMTKQVIHAGLEAAIFKEKYNDIDFVSYGPNMRYIHTTEEVVSLESMDRVYDYTVKILERL